MKVLVATEKPFSKVAVDGIRKIVEAAGYEFAALEKYTSNDELLAAVADADALIVRSDKVTREVVDAAKNLKIVVRAGAGYDNLDLAACTERGIVAMNTPGQNANAVAELAIAFMLFMSRNHFNPGTGCELKGKTLGIQAFGNIGRRVSVLAKGFGMDVLVYAPTAPAQVIADYGVTVATTLEELFEKSDFLTLHIPANEKTKGLIGYDLVSRMPKGACLVNTARKEVINEEELIKVMREREDLKYITDVATANHAAIAEEFGKRVYGTPKKMGAETAEANVNAGLAAANQIVDFFTTGNKKFQVNK